MSDSPHMFDDGRDQDRLLSQHERRRLHDIAARLEFADPGFGARMRFSSDRLSRRRGRRAMPPQGAPSVAASAAPEQRRPRPDDAGGALSERAWIRLVQASVVAVGLLGLLLLVTSGPWAVLATSLLFCLTPLMAIVIYVYRYEEGEPPADPR